MTDISQENPGHSTVRVQGLMSAKEAQCISQYCETTKSISMKTTGYLQHTPVPGKPPRQLGSGLGNQCPAQSLKTNRNKAVPESSRPPSAHRTGPTHADNAGESHFRLQQTSLVKEHLEGHRHCPGRERGRGLCLIATMCLTKHRFFRVSPWVHLILFLRMHSRNLGKRGSSISLAKSAVGPLWSLIA